VIRRQLAQLFGSAISVTPVDAANPESGKYAVEHALIAHRVVFWPSDAVQDALFFSFVELSKDFREQILIRPFPVNRRALLSLKSWPLAIDLYVWLAHRYSTLAQPTIVTLEQLAQQFGTRCQVSTPLGRHDFRGQVERNLRHVRGAYPEARVELKRDGRRDWLQLYPSATPVVMTKATFFSPSQRRRRWLNLQLQDGVYTVSKKEFDHYGEVFTEIDVELQFRRMSNWLALVPARRLPTKSGVSKFIENWMCNAHDKATAQPWEKELDELANNLRR
jgi:replication initiator protein